MLANKAIGTDILTGTGNRHLVNLTPDKSKGAQMTPLKTVSYTHLTLPTTPYV